MGYRHFDEGKPRTKKYGLRQNRKFRCCPPVNALTERIVLPALQTVNLRFHFSVEAIDGVTKRYPIAATQIDLLSRPDKMTCRAPW